MSTSDIYVMGLCYSHDASVTLLKNGVPAVAIQKERLSRRKHDGSIRDINLDKCIEYCLHTEGISITDVKLFVENSPTILFCKEKDKVLGLNQHRMLEAIDPKKIVQVSHHLAHAYAAYGSSEFTSCAVAVIDGQGNYAEDLTEELTPETVYPKNYESSYLERESFYVFSESGYRVVRKNLGTAHKSFVRISGLGHLYETVSAYIFQSRFDAGKVMGLAPYGKASKTGNMIEGKGGFDLNFLSDWVAGHRKPNSAKGDLQKNYEEYSNLAHNVQSEIEDTITGMTQHLSKATGEKNLAYAGGVALNCSTNRKIIDDSGFSNFFFLPPASDCGVSLGCALYGHLSVLGLPKKTFTYSEYLGRPYRKEEIISAAKEFGDLIRHHDVSDLSFEVAQLLTEGNVVAWFQGRSEFGPRALGNRSILADPRKVEMRDFLNKEVKQREGFRPFGASVLESHAAEYFDLGISPFMLVMTKVLSEKEHEIPAVTHVDGTCRIQTVSVAQNEKYYELLTEFYKATSVPMLLNTSFNGADEPIVETPEDAIRAFLSMPIKYLVLENTLIEKKD